MSKYFLVCTREKVQTGNRFPSLSMLSTLSVRCAKNALIVGVACLLVAGCISTGFNHDSAADSHSSGDTEHVDDHPMHALYEIPSGSPIPTISLQVMQDPKSGYNIHVVTTNFVFAPEHASMEHAEGEGHAHIFVDDVKINRLYGEWYHIPYLESGSRTIVVSLNTNDHREYGHDGSGIRASQTILVP